MKSLMTSIPWSTYS